GRKPSGRHIRSWGCKAFYLDDAKGLKPSPKLDARAKMGRFVGFADLDGMTVLERGYLILTNDNDPKSLIIRRNVYFCERDFNFTTKTIPEFDEDGWTEYMDFSEPPTGGGGGGSANAKLNETSRESTELDADANAHAHDRDGSLELNEDMNNMDTNTGEPELEDVGEPDSGELLATEQPAPTLPQIDLNDPTNDETLTEADTVIDTGSDIRMINHLMK
ncbi:hypothetical protein HDU76_011268, partial [Blyttiomyces sp. JEL0837]